jgi:hypothetical protein
MGPFMNDEKTPPKPIRDEAWWRLKNTQVDTFVKIISTASIVGAILVAWGTFSGQKSQAEQNEINGSILDLKVSTEATKISDKKSLVLVNIDLANKGNRTIHPYAHTDDEGKERTYSGEGLMLSVTRHKLPDGEAPVSNGGNDEERVVDRYNILEKKYSYWRDAPWDKVYRIKPANNYRETEAIVLNRCTLYEFVVRFYAIRNGETWTNTETRFVYVE